MKRISDGNQTLCNLSKNNRCRDVSQLLFGKRKAESFAFTWFSNSKKYYLLLRKRFLLSPARLWNVHICQNWTVLAICSIRKVSCIPELWRLEWWSKNWCSFFESSMSIKTPIIFTKIEICSNDFHSNLRFFPPRGRPLYRAVVPFSLGWVRCYCWRRILW